MLILILICVALTIALIALFKKKEACCSEVLDNEILILDNSSTLLSGFGKKSCDCVPDLDIIAIDKDLYGMLQSTGLGHSGGVQGDNVKFKFDEFELTAAKIFIKECTNGKYRQPRNIINDSLKDVINVAILDSPCDIHVIKEYFSITNPSFDINLKNVACTFPTKAVDLNHGTAVIIRFIEKLIINDNTANINIRVYNILDDNEYVKLSTVLCALAKAKKDDNKFVNMSFGFNNTNEVFENSIKDALSGSNIDAITCSAGNEKLELTDSTINIPSGYARATTPQAKIYEVIGVDHNGDLWNTGSYGSNYVQKASRLYAANATIGGSGGTSYAAPRILADLITLYTNPSLTPLEDDFDQIDDGNPNTNIIAFREKT